jgi:hypothetical protein
MATAEPFSEPVRQLLREVMTTFERLEMLLLLHEKAPAALDARTIGELSRIHPDLIPEALQGLTDHGLLARAGETSFRYSPATPALAAVADELVVAYRDQGAAVLSAMSIDAIERIRSGPVRAFADSFVLGKRKPDG